MVHLSSQEKVLDRISLTYMMAVHSKMCWGVNHELDLTALHRHSKCISNQLVENIISSSIWSKPGLPCILCCVCMPRRFYAESVRKNGGIREVTMLGSRSTQLKVFPTMDNVFCSNAQSICRLISICDQFELTSWSRMKPWKSEATLFGNWFSQSSIPFISTTWRCYENDSERMRHVTKTCWSRQARLNKNYDSRSSGPSQ